MLVLTRRSNEKISFPQVGITVHFIRVQSGHVKVGVDAPRDIAIVRDEIADAQAAEALVRRQLLRLPREVRHGICNQLNEIREGTKLYRELVKAGMTVEAEETFATLQGALQRLEDNEVLHPDREGVPSVPGAVVLIDDEPNERELLSGFLRLRGHHVVSFGNGREALDYLANSDRPRFALVNIRMSTCDGPTIVREIRVSKRQRGVRVFAIGCTEPQKFGLEIGERGVNRWFPKPLNPRFLIEALEEEGREAAGRDSADNRRDRSELSAL